MLTSADTLCTQHESDKTIQFELRILRVFFLKVSPWWDGSSLSLLSISTPSSLYWSLSNNVWPLFLYSSQISQAVTTTQTSVTQTTVMETVTMVTTREQILLKHSKEELPPPPPHKKRQLLVDSEIRKRWESLKDGERIVIQFVWKCKNSHLTTIYLFEVKIIFLTPIKVLFGYYLSLFRICYGFFFLLLV